MFSIGHVAKATGVKVPTIRFYEQEGLLPSPARTQSNRRIYADADIRRLTFIRHTRTLGFELEDIRALLDLADNPHRPCCEADEIARRQLQVVEERLRQLTALKAELVRINSACSGGKIAGECRVIEALAGA
ncbi:MAG: helix-turn-helix domain-containing protein [Hyphomonadaceae bacterium]|nr:helix-turn-helix domain-containing protein [Hyphomonadaceae bacterium]